MMTTKGRFVHLLVAFVILASTFLAQPARVYAQDWRDFSADVDGDGLPNVVEENGWYNAAGGAYITNYLDADSDDDGLTDGQEKLYDTNPLNDHSPGIYVEYREDFQTKEYFPWQRYGNKYIALPYPLAPWEENAVVVRRGTTFSVGGPADAEIEIDNGSLTPLTVARDHCAGRWNIEVPSWGTVGTYTITVRDGSWSESLDLYVIFQLLTGMSDAFVDSFVYNDDLDNDKDASAVVYYEGSNPPYVAEYTHSDYDWIPVGEWINHGWTWDFNTQQYYRFVFVDHVMAAIHGKDNIWDAANALGQRADEVTCTDWPRTLTSSWCVLNPSYCGPEYNNKNECTNMAGLLVAFNRSAGIPSRPVFADWQHSSFDHSTEVWTEWGWRVMRGYAHNERPCPDPGENPGVPGGYVALRSTYGWYSGGQGIYAAREDWPFGGLGGDSPWWDAFRQASWSLDKIVKRDWWETRFVAYKGWSSEPRVTGTPPGDWPAPPGRSGLEAPLTPGVVFQFGQVVGDYALDLDGDGRFDQLVFEVEVNARQAGDYWIRGTLAGGFAEAYVNVYLEKGRHTIGLPFDGMDIYMGKVDGPYLLEGLWATDVENPGPADFAENELAYARPAYKTSLYRFSDFGVAGATLSGDYRHYVVDTGDDGYADGLVVETGLDIEEAGIYTVQGVLYDGRDEMISEAVWTGPGPKVTLQFNGLRDTVGPYALQHLHVRDAAGQVTDGIKEPYPIGEVPELSAMPVLLGVESAVPLDPSQPSRLVIIDGYSDTCVDTDSDGRFDQLVITVNMEIEPGEGGQAYRIEGWLLDRNGALVSWTISDPHVLAEGVRSLPLTFDGRIINEHGVDGPLTLVALKALPGSTYSVLDEVDVAYTTSPYDHDEFEEAAVLPAVSIFKDDMESGTSQWTAESVWSLNNSVWHSYSHAWKADASGSQDGSLTTIPLDISNCGAAPTLRLRTCYDMQSPSDVGYLEVSNNGVGWTKVVTYTNSTPHWSNELIDLSDFGEMPDLHLRFNVDSQNELLWYVDDVYVNGWPAIGNNPPNEPSNPSPAHDATDQPLTVDLSWTGGDPDGDSVTYDVYFEANNSSPEVLVSDDQTGTTFDPGNLECGTDYYWMIVAQDEHEATASGGVFHFTTQACSPPVAPTDLGAAAVSRTQIDLTWQDNSSDESDFHIERSPDGVSGWVEVATVGADVTGYSDTGLDCGTTYYYRVRAYRDGDGQYSGYSNVAGGTTQTCPPPAAPSDLDAVPASHTQIDLTWQDNSSDESEFRIERSPDGVSDWAEVATVGVGVTGYSDTGLDCDTTYYYRVRAYRDGDGQYSGYSNVAGGTTEMCPPAAPSDLNGVAVSRTQIVLTWQDNSSDESDFHIERSPDGVSGWTEVATVGTDATGYSDTGLSCGTTYYYRVRAYRDGDDQYSGYSNVANGTTQTCPPPAAPSDLNAMPASHAQIDLTWQDNSSDESEFRIERSPDGASDWSEVATVGADATGYSDTGLDCDTTYYYRVRAYRGSDRQYSDYSNVAGGTTAMCPPAAPTNLNGVAVSRTQIDLTWQDNSSDESDFHIERSPDGVSGWVEVATVGADVTGYSDIGLDCGTTYYYRVRAYRDGDDQYSGYSNVANGTTQTCPPPAAPSDLDAMPASHAQIDLTWQDNSSDESEFRIERSPDGASDWSEVATVGADATGYSDTGLDCDTTYYYRVRAYRGSDRQYSDYSNVAGGTTAMCPPAAPTNLNGVAVSRTQIDLTWQDNSSDESDFHIERSPDGVSGWTEVATVGTDVTGYSDIGLDCGTTYYYRVRAYRDGDDQYSGYSNVANGTTQTCPPPAAPSDLNAMSASHTQIDLTWQTTRLTSRTSTSNVRRTV